MRGQMMDYPLTLMHVLDRVRQLYGKKEIVTKAGLSRARYTYADMTERVARLACGRREGQSVIGCSRTGPRPDCAVDQTRQRNVALAE